MQGSSDYIYSQDRHYKLREVPDFVYSLFNLKKLLVFTYLNIYIFQI